MFIGIENWSPVDGLKLEKTALDVVKELSNNILVIAGPGAGKTELLAQRATCLLETNKCTSPRKILAISFKADAAKNLEERVSKRAPKELARMFISRTFDSFGKGLMDNFLFGLPPKYRPTADYEILTDKEAYKKTKGIANYTLPLDENISSQEKISKLWFDQLHGDSKSYLTFPMISRLAELLINSNPTIKKYLNLTYSHVFFDEFQDTTELQYNLIKACFLESNTVLTAVGDNKQRIMKWAGALATIFTDFQADFGAIDKNLQMNFRCAPKIIKLQQYLMAKALGENYTVIPSSKWKKDEGEILCYLFKDNLQEALESAALIQKWINEDDIKPKDICVIVKQQPDIYAKELIDALYALGISARNENYYQDYLKEELIQILITFST